MLVLNFLLDRNNLLDSSEFLKNPLDRIGQECTRLGIRMMLYTNILRDKSNKFPSCSFYYPSLHMYHLDNL